MNIAIIPARSGSTRIPGKNVRPFLGKPIIAYSIETARESGLFEDIIVSTDSPEYGSIAKAYGAKIHMRNHHLSQNDVGTQEVARAVVKWWAETHELPEYACCIYATAPLMEAADLILGHAIMGQGQDYAYSCGTKPVRDAGQWYWGRATAFLNGIPLEGNSVRFVLPESRVCDINTEEDWQRAERLYQELQEQHIEKEARQ